MTQTLMPHLSGLHIYPVKSLRGCSVMAADVDALGLVGDRRFMVVDEHGRFLSQRTMPRMALIATSLNHDTLILSANGAGAITVPGVSDTRAPLRAVTVWKSEGLPAEDCGDPAAAWLAELLSLKCRLVRIGRDFQRRSLKPKARENDLIGFADAAPFLIVSEASLTDLNDRLVAQGGDALPINRFRPNFVVADSAAFAEDSWKRFRIGDVAFRSGGACARCVVTTTDQDTAERGKEPLRTLATYRRNANDPTNVDFGQNLFHDTKAGTLTVGDTLEILSAN